MAASAENRTFGVVRLNFRSWPDWDSQFGWICMATSITAPHKKKINHEIRIPKSLAAKGRANNHQTADRENPGAHFQDSAFSRCLGKRILHPLFVGKDLLHAWSLLHALEMRRAVREP